MAEAKQCDRCGNFYLPYDGEKYESEKRSFNVNCINIANDSLHKRLDLCPECMQKVLSFLKMEE